MVYSHRPSYATGLAWKALCCPRTCLQWSTSTGPSAVTGLVWITGGFAAHGHVFNGLHPQAQMQLDLSGNRGLCCSRTCLQWSTPTGSDATGLVWKTGGFAAHEHVYRGLHPQAQLQPWTCLDNRSICCSRTCLQWSTPIWATGPSAATMDLSG